MKFRSLLALGLLIGAIYPRSATGLETIVYTDNEFGFRVGYPSDWTSKSLSEIPTARLSVGARPRLSIVLTNGKDGARCLFSVTPFPASKQFPTSSIISRMMEPGAFEDTLRENAQTTRVLDIQRGVFGHQDAIVAIVSNAVPINAFIIHYKGVIEATVRNGVYYQGNCLSVDYAFPKLEQLLRGILNTFTFT